MFLCVSLNPAVDKRLRLERLQVGGVNRVNEAIPAPGGKAAHVAMTLKTLGADPLWLGFAGGATGNTTRRRSARTSHSRPRNPHQWVHANKSGDCRGHGRRDRSPGARPTHFPRANFSGSLKSLLNS